MSGFFALLDDIATLAKLTLSTVDDTASMAVKTSAKVSAAAVDDVATTPQYVTGITPDRELPIIKKESTHPPRNKLLIILPIGLLLTAVAPWLLPVALVIGGAYLCFEGGEKILERFGGAAHAKEETGPVDEAQIIRQAITTDFVLSTEIMLLALAEVEGEEEGVDAREDDQRDGAQSVGPGAHGRSRDRSGARSEVRRRRIRCSEGGRRLLGQGRAGSAHGRKCGAAGLRATSPRRPSLGAPLRPWFVRLRFDSLSLAELPERMCVRLSRG